MALNGTSATKKLHTKNHDYVVQFVKDGDRYGRDNCMTFHAQPGEEGLIEFFQAKPIGFISRYQVSTWMGEDEFIGTRRGRHTTGVSLMGGSDFVLTADEANSICDWIEEER